ncbi:MAG: HD-GYP domain-containing protein [Gallionellaceae bacterium]|nr:MAG: HD-GYP domain-containing protein [Gallionellaceae bacterium]
MDTTALLQPRISDAESLQDFADSLNDHAPLIERDIARLKHSPGDAALIADLFRAMHTVKGDAALCKIDMGVMIAHPIETLLGRLRAGEIGFSGTVAEAVLLALDRLELATEALSAGRAVSHLKLVELVGGLEELSGAPADKLDEQAVLVIEAVTGFRPPSAAKTINRLASAQVRNAEDDAADLRFFRSLALRYEGLSPQYSGRSDRQLRLALETNAVAGKPVDPLQLEAAVYMHDIGMLFIPEAKWLKTDKLSEEEKRLLQDHASIGAGLLERMAGWQAAAAMVLQHHEMVSGGGYPRGLKDNQINPGAKLLAIIDTFEAVTLKYAQHGEQRSLVRAIAEINACDNQFAPEWIAHFNAVIRRMVES